MSARKGWRKTSFGEGDDWWLSVSFSALSAVTPYPISYSRNWAVVVLVGRKTSESSLKAIPTVLSPAPQGLCWIRQKPVEPRSSKPPTFQPEEMASSDKGCFNHDIQEWLWVKEYVASHLHVDKSKGGIAQSEKILLLEGVSSGLSKCVGLILHRGGRHEALVQRSISPTCAVQHLVFLSSCSDLSLSAFFSDRRAIFCNMLNSTNKLGFYFRLQIDVSNWQGN